MIQLEMKQLSTTYSQYRKGLEIRVNKIRLYSCKSSLCISLHDYFKKFLSVLRKMELNLMLG